LLLAVAGIAGFVIGWVALRQIDDRPGEPVLRDLWRSITRR
jgi:dTMP kinase